jgi:hypothetical protein
MFSSLIHATTFNLSCLVIFLTIVRIYSSYISVVPHYASSDFLPMPVTIRSQARKLQNTLHHECSITSSLGSSVSRPKQSNTTLAVSPFIPTTTTSSTIDPSSTSLCDHVNVINPNRSIGISSLEFETTTTISKFQTSNPSRIDNFDPGICHNSSFLKSVIMEEACEESDKPSSTMVDKSDLNHLFAALTTHLTLQTDRLHARFQQVTENHDDFKIEVRQELDALRALIQHNQTVSQVPWHPVSMPSIKIQGYQPVSSSGVQSAIPVAPAGASPHQSNVESHSSSLMTSDIQSQMLLMLTESFSKLSTALTEKSSDFKADWPKFSGDSRKFRAWYLAIMSQLSLAPWLELYDSTINDVIPTMSNSILNGKLYSKLILALEGTALQNTVSRKHLRANGLLLLQDLVQTYKPRNVPEVIAAKTDRGVLE